MISCHFPNKMENLRRLPADHDVVGQKFSTMMYRKKQGVEMSNVYTCPLRQTLFDSFGVGPVLFSMMYHVA